MRLISGMSFYFSMVNASYQKIRPFSSLPVIDTVMSVAAHGIFGKGGWK